MAICSQNLVSRIAFGVFIASQICTLLSSIGIAYFHLSSDVQIIVTTTTIQESEQGSGVALLVVGSNDNTNGRSVEAIGANGSSLCSLPDLPGTVFTPSKDLRATSLIF